MWVIEDQRTASEVRRWSPLLILLLCGALTAGNERAASGQCQVPEDMNAAST